MGKSSKMPKLEVDSPPPSVPETKKVKNGKRCSNESLDKEVSSKKEKKEVEQVGFNKEKAQKLNKISMDPLGQKEEENRNLDFEKVAEAPIIVLSTKGAKIGKRGNENVPEKQARSKKQKIEAESSSQSYKKAKKMKRILVEPLKEEDESISSDFDEEGIHANLRCTNWSANDTPIPLAWRGARGKGCIFSENCLPCFRNLAWFYVIRASSANERDAQVENELKGMKKNLKSMEKQCDPMCSAKVENAKEVDIFSALINQCINLRAREGKLIFTTLRGDYVVQRLYYS